MVVLYKNSKNLPICHYLSDPKRIVIFFVLLLLTNDLFDILPQFTRGTEGFSAY